MNRVASMVLLAGWGLLATGGSVAAQSTERASVDSAGGQANGTSAASAVSADGRFVAFSSAASNLVPDDTNGVQDIFVRDRRTGATERVSVSLAGIEGNGPSSAPAISADGRFVAFASDASNFLPDDTNGKDDIFVFDRETDRIERVSRASDGSQADSNSAAPAISADGRLVAFESFASNLAPDDTFLSIDIFVHDRQAGVTERVTTPGPSGSLFLHGAPAISGDGRFVAFESEASDLVPDDTNGAEDVFVYDRQTGTTERVSLADDEGEGNSWSNAPAISAGGRFVAFTAQASNLVLRDVNGQIDVFVRDRLDGATDLMSRASSGRLSDFASSGAAISADGRFVAFSSLDDLGSPDGNGVSDVFVRDRETNTTERLSVDSAGNSGNDASLFVDLSADGRFAAFQSAATDLVPGDTNDRPDIFLRDRAISTPQLRTAVLPYARAVAVGTPATAFATVINDSERAATGCFLGLPSSVPGGFTYQTTDSANALTGSPDTPVDIAAGGTQGFVFGITPSAAMPATEISMIFDCFNASPADSFVGLNTFILSASSSPPADMLAVGVTPSGDGIVNIPGADGTGFFAIAARNIGGAASITASVDDGGRELPIILSLCETEPSTGACKAPPSGPVTRPVAAGELVTYTAFVAGSGTPVAFDPAGNRLFFRFADDSDDTVGATNVAVRTQ